jgi:hypothetical protein
MNATAQPQHTWIESVFLNAAVMAAAETRPHLAIRIVGRSEAWKKVLLLELTLDQFAALHNKLQMLEARGYR